MIVSVDDEKAALEIDVTNRLKYIRTCPWLVCTCYVRSVYMSLVGMYHVMLVESLDGIEQANEQPLHRVRTLGADELKHTSVDEHDRVSWNRRYKRL